MGMLAWLGVTTTATKLGAACGWTVTLPTAKSVPLLAVMVAVPCPTPVAKPVAFTDAVSDGTANQLIKFVRLFELPSV